jgi:hypothetical protein
MNDSHWLEIYLNMPIDVLLGSSISLFQDFHEVDRIFEIFITLKHMDVEKILQLIHDKVYWMNEYFLSLVTRPSQIWQLVDIKFYERISSFIDSFSSYFEFSLKPMIWFSLILSYELFHNLIIKNFNLKSHPSLAIFHQNSLKPFWNDRFVERENEIRLNWFKEVLVNGTLWD